MALKARYTWLLTCVVAVYALSLPLHYGPLNSSTFDEGNHIATGLEWWQHGRYEWFTVTPPLARIVVAALPYAAGVRLPPRAEWDPHLHSFFTAHVVGEEVLGTGYDYAKRLQLARHGTLGFFALLLWGTWALARGGRRPASGLLAVAFVATLPALTAHAALATTDVALAAVWVWFLVLARAYVRHPTWHSAVGVGAAAAAGILTKFTFLILAPIGLVAILASESPKLRRLLANIWRSAREFWVAVGVTAFLVWAGYRFSWGPIVSLPSGSGELSAFNPVDQLEPWQLRLLSVPLPAPELFHGLLFAARHQLAPQPSYLLGETSNEGFPLFYAVALLVKTPLPGLAMASIALVTGVALRLTRRRTRPRVPTWCWLVVGVVLAATTVSPYNLGVRHLLPLYPLMGVGIAGTLTAYWTLLASRSSSRAVLAASVVILYASQVFVSFQARQNALAYFNPLAGSEPGKVLVGSDFDWGQDLFRLRDFAEARGIRGLATALFGMSNPCVHELPKLKALDPSRPMAGWVAISETFFRHHGGFAVPSDPCNPRLSLRPPTSDAFHWLERYAPVERLGGVRVYQIPETAAELDELDITAETRPSGIVEIESGGFGEEVVLGQDGGTQYLTARTNADESTRPVSPRRLVNLQVAVPLAGAYDIYLRYRVGVNRYDDDSLFLAKELGPRDPNDQRQWDIINGLVGVGYSQPNEVVGGAVGLTVNAELQSNPGAPLPWRWLNLSAYRQRTPGIRFAHVQPETLNLAVREDGLELDKLIFVPTGVEQTVAELDKGEVRRHRKEAFGLPPEFVPPGPALATGRTKYLGGIHSPSQELHFRRYFNHVTPENAGKWGSVEATRDVMDWRELDSAYALAKAETPQLPFRMHALVWGNQQPAWIEDLPISEQRREIDEWFAAIARRYGTGLDYVEVVNEPLNDPPSQRGEGGGNYIQALAASGQDRREWVINAYVMAREMFPGAKLMINEYGVLEGTDLTNQYLDLVRALKDQQLVDVIGVQAHGSMLRGSTPVIDASLRVLAQLELPIMISELDITEHDDAQQLAEFQRVFPLLWENPAVEGAVLWGYRPGMWMGAQGGILAHENGVERPAFKWLREYLRRSAPEHSN